MDSDQHVIELNTGRWLARIMEFSETLGFTYDEVSSDRFTLDFDDIDGEVLWNLLDFASTKAKAYDGPDEAWCSFVTANPHQPGIFSVTFYCNGVPEGT